MSRCVLELVSENERLRAAQDCSTESGRALTPEEITELGRSLQREPISEGSELLRLVDDGCPNVGGF